MQSGYSGTPLSEKLGIKPGTRVMLINPPAGYGALLLRQESFIPIKPGESPDLVQLFVTSEAQLYAEMQKLKALVHPKIVIWVSWYKKSSGIQTDVSEDSIRNYALKHDLVDVKVCAIDEHWSGLKLVVPLFKR